MDTSNLLYDWNLTGAFQIPRDRTVMVDDETLRDGLQNPSVHDPSISEKFEILHLMEALGIDTVTIGMPGAGDRALADSRELAREIGKARLKIRPMAVGRTCESDIVPIARVIEQAGIAVDAALFLGTSPIRRLVEDWSLDHLLRTTESAVCSAVAKGLFVLYSTEDTIRTDPDTIKRLYTAAIECGARAIALCDTVGHATPVGVYNLVRFVIDEIVKPSGEQVRIDWHGHCDRGLAVINSLAAFLAGADQIHAAANSLGERVGNTPMELLLVNLKLLGIIDRDLSRLKEYCDTVARATHTTIPPNAPVVGRDAFRTASGIHAAAIVKAYRKNDPMLANLLYSGVPSHLFGLKQVIDIGPMSGRSNVVYWLEKRGLSASEEQVERILHVAKSSTRVLSEEEVTALTQEMVQT